MLSTKPEIAPVFGANDNEHTGNAEAPVHGSHGVAIEAVLNQNFNQTRARTRLRVVAQHATDDADMQIGEKRHGAGEVVFARHCVNFDARTLQNRRHDAKLTFNKGSSRPN